MICECDGYTCSRHDESNVSRLERELEQAKAQQVHCMACGGVECRRLAEIVQLTGMASDQHLVEWVEQAKQAKGYLGRLLLVHYQHIELLDNLLGVCTQIDNGLAVALTKAKRGQSDTQSHIECRCPLCQATTGDEKQS